MSDVVEQMRTLAPALAFLLVGVPLAALLDELGFFDALAAALLRRRDGRIPVLWLWLLAAATTAVLNLDTTVVLLTPLYLRIARRADHDPFALAVVPLLLASLASSMLPVSNLTNLIVVEQLGPTTWDVVAHLGLPSLAAIAAGWLAYRRRFPSTLTVAAAAVAAEAAAVAATVDPRGTASASGPDRRALAIGGVVVGALLAAFVVGPSFGLAPWFAVAAADVVLVGVVRRVPWRSVPVATALLVAAVAAAVALVVPSETVGSWVQGADPAATPLVALAAVGAANVVNNLPALLAVTQGADAMTWGVWAWLLGVNVGAVLVPIGALANLLWKRIAADEAMAVDLRSYLRTTVAVAGPAVLAAIAVLTASSLFCSQ